MKKVLFILSVCLITVTACNKATKHSVVGKWKPVEMNLPEMSDETKKEMLQSTVIEFTSDGKYSHAMKGYKDEGTYIYNATDSTLVATSKDDDEKFKISWDGDMMVMTNGDGVVKLKH